MFNVSAKLKTWLIKRVALRAIVNFLDRVLSRLPGNESKTVNGITVAVLSLALNEFPDSAEYVQPVLDHLHEFPFEAVAGGGIGWAIVGAFHKAIKILKKYLAPEPPVVVTG